MRQLSLLVSVASGLSHYIATTPSGQVVATLHRHTLPREPLTVDYQEKFYAGGRIPGRAGGRVCRVAGPCEPLPRWLPRRGGLRALPGPGG